MQHVLREAGLARSVQVVNVAGAAGTIGLARFVSSETGNSDALLITGLVMVSGVVTNRSPVTLANVTPVARLSGEYEVIVVPAASPLRSLSDLIAAFRANPRAVSWGGGSAGGTDEILVRLLAGQLGLDPTGVNYIAYSGGGQALASVLGAHVSAAVSGLGEFGSQIESGGLRALAISSPDRVPGVDVPTFREQGVDLSLLNWRGVVAPPGLTRAERADLVALVGRMATSPQWKAELARNGWADLYMESEAFARFLTDETARVSTVVGTARPSKHGIGGYELFVLIGGSLAAVFALGAAAHRRAAAPRTDRPASRSITRVAENGSAPLYTLGLALLANVVLIEWTGFLLASALMFVIVARAFGSRRLMRDTLAGLALSAIVYLCFTRGLGVTLPTGLFG